MATLDEIKERKHAVMWQFNDERRAFWDKMRAEATAFEEAQRDKKDAFLADITMREKAAVAEATNGQCIAEVWKRGYSERCERLSGFGRNGDYCKQHAKQHPETEAPCPKQ